MPSLPSPFASPLASLLGRARSWSLDSQQVARCNAMLACTKLAARRAEREDVEDYLARAAEAAPSEPVAGPRRFAGRR